MMAPAAWLEPMYNQTQSFDRMSQQHHRGRSAFPTIRFSVLAQKPYPGGSSQISQRNQVAITEIIKLHTFNRGGWHLGARHRRVDLILNILAYGQSSALIIAKAAFSSLQGFLFPASMVTCCCSNGKLSVTQKQMHVCSQHMREMRSATTVIIVYVCMTCELFIPHYSSDTHGFKQETGVSFKTLECSGINY